MTSFKMGHVVLFIAIALIGLAVFLSPPMQAESLFQSELPRPPNPFWVGSAAGGRVSCGPAGGTVWLNVPAGFTTEGGAEIHCDPTRSLSAWNGTKGAWDDRGYLIGVYPPVPLTQPLLLVIEIDPARAGGVCNTCWVGRSFDGAGSWQREASDYNTGTQRARISIAAYPPASGYPDYQDRYLFALFQRRPTPTPSPRPTQAPSETAAPPQTVAPAAETTGPTPASLPVTGPTAAAQVEPTGSVQTVPPEGQAAEPSGTPTSAPVAAVVASPQAPVPIDVERPSALPLILVGAGIWLAVMGIGLALYRLLRARPSP